MHRTRHDLLAWRETERATYTCQEPYCEYGHGKQGAHRKHTYPAQAPMLAKTAHPYIMYSIHLPKVSLQRPSEISTQTKHTACWACLTGHSRSMRHEVQGLLVHPPSVSWRTPPTQPAAGCRSHRPPCRTCGRLRARRRSPRPRPVSSCSRPLGRNWEATRRRSSKHGGGMGNQAPHNATDDAPFG